jgi:hypothetical protein
MQVQELSCQAKSQVRAGLEPAEWIEEYNRLFAQLVVEDCVRQLLASVEHYDIRACSSPQATIQSSIAYLKRYYS